MVYKLTWKTTINYHAYKYPWNMSPKPDDELNTPSLKV